MNQWIQSPEARSAMSPSTDHSACSLSSALMSALHRLVALAGGWRVRPKVRRTAYDSNQIRQVRRKLALQHRLQRLLRPLSSLLGCWPRPLLLLQAELHSLGVSLSSTTLVALRAESQKAASVCRQELEQLVRQMRQERQSRWRSTLPEAWRDRPGIIYNWLQARSPVWGSSPIMDDNGMQCTTLAAVDVTVRQFWVSDVLHRHAAVDGDSAWAAFSASLFSPHIPSMEWPSQPWSGVRVRDALFQLPEASSPGALGIPIAVWRSLPSQWFDAVARLFTLMESDGEWPVQWLDAYVVMIPKASGGTRPRDQRPITVLEVMYRIWSKGLVREWGPAIQRHLLGVAAMGFRAQTGALHVAQVLSDLISLRRRPRRPLYLASFDLEKCYDTIPWWAIFGILKCSGAPASRIATLRHFYGHLRRCFRYGQAEGQHWFAANGFPQGCSLSPDLLNLLMEPFHRWARANDLGVPVGDTRIPSLSFADDLALVSDSQPSMVTLIEAYLSWCELLGLRVTKVQLWTNVGPCTIRVAGLEVVSSPTFRIVGVVLGQDEARATALHVGPRLEKAKMTAMRLWSLDLPASICSLLWRTTVLPQALYGCEIRDVSAAQLLPLSSLGKSLLRAKSPLQLSVWRSPAALCGPPLGDTALKAPMVEMRERQLDWLQLLVNLPSLAGYVHRVAAWRRGVWEEPALALRSCLRAAGWSVRRNPQCIRAAHWPKVDPEEPYPGVILLRPEDSFPLPEAVFTDGSLSMCGGAAAVQEDAGVTVRARLPIARSSTQCELAALCLAMSLHPPQILTDSLCSLQLLLRWAQFSPKRVLSCVDRVAVRQVIALASQCPTPPLLEKVLAHDAAGIAAGHPKAAGNDAADREAQVAAMDPSTPVWAPESSSYGDPVDIVDAAGEPVADVKAAFQQVWWRQQVVTGKGTRVWLASLYPETVQLDWPVSTCIFRRPTPSGAHFVHLVAPSVIKWLARIRTGSLATRARRHKRGLSPSPACPCCAAEVEDDAHVIAGCPATGSAEWCPCVQEAWMSAAAVTGLHPSVPTHDQLASYKLQLMAALIPIPLIVASSLQPSHRSRFFNRLHVELAVRVAQLLGRRETLILHSPEAPLVSGLGTLAMAPLLPSHLPPERQLSVEALRALERDRRVALAVPDPSASSSSSMQAVPLAGNPRKRWMRARLLTLLQEDTQPCAAFLGSTAAMLVELFERVTGEPFTDVPGSLVDSRIGSLSRTLPTFVRDYGSSFSPPLETVSALRQRNLVTILNRFPRHPCSDIQAWKRKVKEREQYQAAAPRPQAVIGARGQGLAAWLREHRYLRPVDISAGESSMALLLLWEVDHGREWPSNSNNRTGALASFTKCLTQQVAQEDELKEWLIPKYCTRSLPPGSQTATTPFGQSR